MENQRLMLAALLSAVILVAWQVLLPKPPAVAPPEGQEIVAESAAEPGQTRSVETKDPAEQPAVEEPETPRVVERIAADTESEVTIETPRLEARFTNRGAQLLSYRITSQSDEEDKPFELIRQRGADLYPFSLVFGDRGSRLNSALFTMEQRVEEGRKILHFRHSSDLGVAEKIFSWDEQGMMYVEIRVDAEGWGVVLGPGLGNEKSKSSHFLDHAVGFYQDGDLETLKAEKVKEKKSLPRGSFDWMAIENNYFLVAAIPQSGVADVEVRPVLQRSEVQEGRPRFLPADTSASEEDLQPELLVVFDAESQDMVLATYFGSKRYSYLSSLPFSLEQSVRWGSFIGLLAKPLYLILLWIHANVVANFGWAIILVTILIRLVFFPLTHKSQKSMSKMQELNPKVQAIRNKFRPKLKDKQGRPNVEAQRQMNEEVMAVYKTAGVNPAAGCLPLVLQMPVFFAFYRLLTTSVELRRADWLLWIHDLSSPDPYFLLPLLMGVTSVLVQRMTPSPPDAMQRRVMQMMPIMFTAFAFYFPSGLVVYWMTNNLLTMGQQSLINKMKNR